MISTPEVCVLKTDGTNCDAEMSYAFEANGAKAETVHINQLREGDRKLDDYEILALSGGFSYGDDIASGKVLANELTSLLSDQLQEFTDKEKPILGICNGFQVLIRTGLLPYGTIGQQQVTLAENQKGRFECRWINLGMFASACRFIQPDDFKYFPIPMQVAHGEGRFFGSEDVISKLINDKQIVFRYGMDYDTDPHSDGYPANPNGSVGNIAGICDPTGLILGMMPHPERSIEAFHPDRNETEAARSAANILFKNIVEYANAS